MFWTRKNLASTCVLLVAIAMLGGCEDRIPKNPVNPPVQPAENTNTLPTNPVESTEGQVYWLQEEGEHLVLAPQAIAPSQDPPEVVLNKLFVELLAQAPEAELISTIPENTTLLNTEINDDGIVIDLSEEFTFGGGSASMIGRLAQVLYTATSFSPDAVVWIRVAGEPLELLGGEGLEVAQPLTRQIFEAEFEL